MQMNRQGARLRVKSSEQAGIPHVCGVRGQAGSSPQAGQAGRGMQCSASWLHTGYTAVFILKSSLRCICRLLERCLRG